jgi:hypothetical protein
MSGLRLPLTESQPNGINGRVAGAANFDGEIGLPGFATQTAVETDFQNDMLRGNWEKTTLSASFFSSSNIERLQQLVRTGVYDGSPKGYVIDKQSVDEMKIIMRAIFYQYSRNMPDDIMGQVNDLNQKVVDWSVPHILSAVDHYHYYINDISHLPIPMEQPQHLSSAGTKSLPMNPFM